MYKILANIVFLTLTNQSHLNKRTGLHVKKCLNNLHKQLRHLQQIQFILR